MMRVSFALNGAPSLRAVRSLLSSDKVNARCVVDVEEGDLGPVLRDISQHHVSGLDVGIAEDVPFTKNAPQPHRQRKAGNGQTISDVIVSVLRKAGAKGMSFVDIRQALAAAGFSYKSGASNVNSLLRSKQIKRVKPGVYAVR